VRERAASLQKRLSIWFAALAIMVSALVVFVLYACFYNMLYQDFCTRLLDMAGIAALRVDGDAILTLTDPSQRGGEAGRSIERTLRMIRDASSDIRFVYTMREDAEGKIRFIVAAETPQVAVAQLGDVYDDAGPVLKRSFHEMSKPVVEDSFYTDKWETVLSGYAPFYASDGTRAGILGIDISAARIREEQGRFLRGALAGFFFTIPIILIAGLILSRRLAAPIVALTRTAQVIADGDLERVAVVSDPDEVGVLANAFNEMTGKLRASLLSLRTEIKERQRAEEELSESEKKYRSLFEQVHMPLVVFAQDGRIEYLNDRFTEIFGYTLDDIPKEGGLWFLVYRDAAKRAQAHGIWDEVVKASSASGRPVSGGQLPVTCKSGEIRDVEFSFSFIRGKGLAICNDVTERNRAEAARRQAEESARRAQQLESLGVLAGGIAHDFNNLLTGILGNAEMAEESLPRSSQARPLLSEIETAAQRAAELARQMLAYAGKGRFAFESMNLSDLVREMGKLLEASISKRASLRYLLSGDPCVTEGDPTQIRQVVMNLITNASEAITGYLGEAGNGVITLSTGCVQNPQHPLEGVWLGELPSEGRCVYLEVKDTGGGMPPDVISKIFEPFYTTKFAGRGLGLAAVLGIVRSHRGAIWILSAPGKGSTFRVMFPAVEAKLHQPAEVRDTDGWMGTGAILVVDDEEQVRDVARRMLEAKGFSVITAADGLEAIRIVETQGEKIAAVILDLAMPNMDGKTTLERIRFIHPTMRVILSSGYDENELSTVQGDRHSGFVAKPYKSSELINAVKKALLPRPDAT
jgi:PAS domain S-box-containing protein